MDLRKATFRGYKRDDGRIGVRNHVLILPVDDLSNAACEAVASNIKGTLAIPHPYGRLQFGADLELHFKTLIGTGSNPNVAAVVVIGIEDGWAKRVADGIAATGKPVSFFGIEGHGDTETIRRASKAAKDYLQWASELRREERPLRDLWVSTKCGESDTNRSLRSEEHTSELQSLAVISYAVFCLKKKTQHTLTTSSLLKKNNKSNKMWK